MSRFKFSQKSYRNLHGVDPKMIELMETALKRSPIDFGVPVNGGLRTAQEQRQLNVKGLSKCDGYKRRSRHQSGKAVDVYAYVNGEASWEKVHLAIIAGVILSVAAEMGLHIVWGGTFGSNSFNGWDFPHFELIEDKPWES